MRIQKTKVLTGTMLSVLLWAVSVYPAFARPAGEAKSMQIHSQMNNTQTVRGTIKSIVGDMVMLEMPNGKTQQIIINPDDLGRLNLERGMQIAVMLDKQNMASNVRVVEMNTASTYSTRVNTTRRQQVTTQRRTVQTTSTPAAVQTPVQTTEVTQTVEVERQSANTRPLRALW